jgi:hypothetical protein
MTVCGHERHSYEDHEVWPNTPEIYVDASYVEYTRTNGRMKVRW